LRRAVRVLLHADAREAKVLVVRLEARSLHELAEAPLDARAGELAPARRRARDDRLVRDAGALGATRDALPRPGRTRARECRVNERLEQRARVGDGALVCDHGVSPA